MISITMLTAAPQIIDPKMNMMMHDIITFRRPKMSANFPYNGCEALNVSRYAAGTHVIFSAPLSCAVIFGSAGATTVEFKLAMKVASANLI